MRFKGEKLFRCIFYAWIYGLANPFSPFVNATQNAFQTPKQSFHKGDGRHTRCRIFVIRFFLESLNRAKKGRNPWWIPAWMIRIFVPPGKGAALRFWLVLS